MKKPLPLALATGISYPVRSTTIPDCTDPGHAPLVEGPAGDWWMICQDGGKSWTLHRTRMEVSGIHHNVFGGFLSLKVGVCCAGNGAVTLAGFRYHKL